MKNRSSFYFTLLTFMLIACIKLDAAAPDYTPPPKPEYHIADHAMIFDSSAIYVLQSHSRINILRRVHVEPYLLTIQESYWKDIDTISQMVCKAWGICGSDSAALLIMSTAKHPRFRIMTGQGAAAQINDTVTSFLEEFKLPDMAKLHSSQEVAAFFFKSVKLDAFNRVFNKNEDYFSSFDYDEYESGKEIVENGKLLSEYDKFRFSYVKTERARIYDISASKIIWFSFICMAIVGIYLLMWTGYQTKYS